MASTGAHAAASTAYDALRVIQTTRGPAVMAQLVDVRGETGMPQPQVWTILLKDPEARAGIREFVVASGEIRSERTPLRRLGRDEDKVPLDFARLNLDSAGAFKIAESQAKQMRAGFNSVDYSLQTDTSTGSPVWDLRLFDHMGAPVGDMRVSAVDGKVIQPLRLDADSRLVTESARPTSARTPQPTPDPSATPKPMGGFLGAVSRTAGTVAEQTKDVSIGVVGSVEEFLTGDRTIGREAPRESPTPAR